MTKSVLIIGYGRAGKRHAKIAKDLDLRPYVYDPYLPPEEVIDLDYSLVFARAEDDLGDILQQADYGHVVIATPPDSHLRYIRLCLDSGLPVLCEKPLCALDQLDEVKALLDHPNANKAMVAYNWRYHPKLKQAQKSLSDPLVMDCQQQRNDLPEWGLLLDHCSHDLDILRFVSAVEPKVIRAKYTENSKRKSWVIRTDNAHITETVMSYEGIRIANLYYTPGQFIELDPDPKMYADMWQAFLRGDYRPGLDEAIKTQELLEKCHQLNGEDQDD